MSGETQYTKLIDKLMYGYGKESVLKNVDMTQNDWVQLAMACLDQGNVKIPQELIDDFGYLYKEMF